jgi:hypothetical protein
VSDDCDCGYDPGGLWTCIHGTVFGPCVQETCEGICEPKCDCTCTCHEPAHTLREDT